MNEDQHGLAWLEARSRHFKINYECVHYLRIFLKSNEIKNQFIAQVY